MKAVNWWRERPRRHKWVIIGLVLYGLYGVLGYFAGSPMLRSTIVSALEDATGRPVKLERAVFNPYGLSVTLEDFAFHDPGGGEFIAFDRFYTDFELSSLFRWSFYFDVIELDRPRIRVTRTGPAAFNFDDLLALARSDSAEEPAAEEPGGMLPFSIGELSLSKGDLQFRDLTRTEPQTMLLDDISFEVLEFSTRSDGGDGNDYSLGITSPGGGRFHWTGNLGVDPLALDGGLELAGLELSPFAEFYQDRLRFSVPAGRIDIATQYRLDLGDDRIAWSLADGSLRLRNLRIQQPDLEDETLTVPEMDIDGVVIDSTGQTVNVESLAFRQPSLLVRQLQDGVDLQRLLADDADEASSDRREDQRADTQTEATGQGDPGKKDSSSWRFRLASLALEQARLRYRDNTLRNPGELALEPLNLSVSDIQSGGEGDFRYEGDGVLFGKGELAFSGRGNLNPLWADLQLTATDLSLTPLEPWVREGAELELPSGQLSTEIEARLRDLDSDPQVTATGGLSGEAIGLNEAGGRAIVSLDAFEVMDIDFDLQQRSLSSRRVDLDGLVLESVIDERGRNVGDRIALPAEDAETATENADGGPAWTLRAAEVNLANSTLAFADESMTPGFSLGLYRLSGSVSNLDSSGEQSARLSLTADVDRYAPLAISGEIRPDVDDPLAGLNITLENYEMTGLTPYTGRYIGYAVSRGQLDLDSRLDLAGTKLDSSADLRAADFFLGEKVESEQAVNAPVKLGLAVLRNREGLIRLPVKAAGDLADPSVSVSGIILQAITNVMVKAATSPFSVLSSLAGGEELDKVVFPSGSASLDGQSRNRLESLARVLAERPTLKVTLAGSRTREDRLALSRQDRIDVLGGDDWTGLEAAAESGFFRRRVRGAYEQELGEDPENLATPAENADADARAAHERRIAIQAFEALVEAGADAVEESRLSGLAAKRARVAKAWLVEDGGIDGGRVLLQSEALGDRDPVSGVLVGLTTD